MGMSRLGFTDQTGRLYVTTTAPSATIQKAGLLLGQPGGPAFINNTNTPIYFVNGLPVMSDGKLCFHFTGSIAYYLGGLPRTITGRLVTAINAPFTPSDTFVGKVRVGPSGVYTTDLTPPVTVTGFSSGFSNGFGATI